MREVGESKLPTSQTLVCSAAPQLALIDLPTAWAILTMIINYATSLLHVWNLREECQHCNTTGRNASAAMPPQRDIELAQLGEILCLMHMKNYPSDAWHLVSF